MILVFTFIYFFRISLHFLYTFFCVFLTSFRYFLASLGLHCCVGSLLLWRAGVALCHSVRPSYGGDFLAVEHRL